jgi:hypothetical protein
VGEFPLQVGACALAAYAASWAGFRKSLREFPWEETSRARLWKSAIGAGVNVGDGPWPRVHSAQASERFSPLPWWKPWAIAAWAGWFAACATAATLWFGLPAAVDRLPTNIAAGVFIVAIIGALGRLALYLWEHRPPISLAGRLATGRLIIPRYDVALVAPLLVVELGRRLPEWLHGLGTPLPATAFVSLFVVIAVLFGMGPTLRWWHLVGEHRLVLSKPASRPRRARERG